MRRQRWTCQLPTAIRSASARRRHARVGSQRAPDQSPVRCGKSSTTFNSARGRRSNVTSRDRGGNESGAILIIVMVVMAVAVIALTAAVQAWSTTWRRDNEEELIFRAHQYVDAIIAYRKEHGGQFPLNLEDLHKPGPRRFRYIRKLYKEPIAKDHKWGLLYLMPGGQGVYDPKAAQKAQEKASKDWGTEWQTAGSGPLAQTPGQMPGVTPIGQNALGSGVPGTGGMPAGSLPGSAMPIQGNLPMIPPPIPGENDQKQPGEEE